MPTSTRESILANVKTTLEAITAGTYNTTVRRVIRGLIAPADQIVTPMIFFTATDAAGPPLEGGGSSSGLDVWLMKLDVTGIVERGYGPSDTAANALMHDILYAMGQDRTRGGYARNCVPVLASTEVVEGPGEPWAIVNVGFEVVYRVDHANPATVR